MRFAILIDKTATGYSAHVPELPGRVAAGETREETPQLIREATAFRIERMWRHGQTVPEPTTSCECVDVVMTA